MFRLGHGMFLAPKFSFLFSCSTHDTGSERSSKLRRNATSITSFVGAILFPLPSTGLARPLAVRFRCQVIDFESSNMAWTPQFSFFFSPVKCKFKIQVRVFHRDYQQ